MTLFVFGHRNPDTDAVCSALAYADLLQRTTRPDAVAACCGTPNKRTEFALRRAGIPAPRIIMDIRPELGDVGNRTPAVAYADDVFYDVYRRMQQDQLRAIPVLDADQQIVGIVNLLELLELVLAGGVDPIQSRQVDSTLDQVAAVLEGKFQHAVEADRVVDFVVTVGAMSAGGFRDRISEFPAERLMVVSGDRPTIQLPALEFGVRALIVTGGYQLSSELLTLAKARRVTVINSPYDTATTIIRIKAAQRIAPVIQRQFATLPANMPIETARHQVFRSTQTVFPVVDDGRLVGVVGRSDLVCPPRPEIVLVDHNELSQAVEGAADANIVEVLDHHRIGGSLTSSHPIRMQLEPVGSTCTLVARMFQRAQITPTPAIALCLASGIISDTLFLRSPTSTDTDRQMLDWLRPVCRCDLDKYAAEFFQVGSALRSCTADQVVREDCKEFAESGRRFSISQIEEIGLDLFWQRKDELGKALAVLSATNGLEFSALLVTDLSTNGSLLLVSREPDGWQEINFPQLERNLYRLDNVVSRKKQLLPLIISLMDTDGAAPPAGH